MLKKLAEAFGPSGCEDEVRKIIIDRLDRLGLRHTTDSMGNVICRKSGNGGMKNTVMLCAHMDEVGFIICGVTDDGGLLFKAVGGIDDRILQNSTVLVGDKRICGVIGAKPAHMSKDSKTPVKIDELVIDIGAKSREDALLYVSIGDYAVFKSDFIEFGSGRIKSKALDDRIGCYTLLRLAEHDYPNDIYFVFTVQEEVGCRGAAVAANRLKPDFAIVVEGTTCSDVPFCDKYSYSTILGGGAALSMLDGGSYSDRELTELLHKTAEKSGISVQYKRVTSGGNDANAVQVSCAGVRTAAISVPCRYIHSPVSVAVLQDIESCCNILYNCLREENGLWSY